MHFVIPDIHGHVNTLAHILEKEEIIENGERVNHDVTVVQLGDLANCVGESRVWEGKRFIPGPGNQGDINCLSKVGNWIDVYLVGNHEAPYFGCTPFSGFVEVEPVKAAVMEAAPIAAYSIGDILLTHAGLTTNFNEFNAQEMATYLNEAWARDKRSNYFNDVGKARGGWYPTGGILWSDVSEQKTTDKFRQIFGHTACQERELRMHPFGRWFCLDTYGPHGS